MRTATTLSLLCLLTVPLPAAADIADAIGRAKAGVFDASGEVACAQEVGEVMGRCDASVARAGPGEAAVVVTFPNGFRRTLIFEDGVFLRGNPTMSGVGTDIDRDLSGGVHSLRVDDQRFDLPAVLVFGR